MRSEGAAAERGSLRALVSPPVALAFDVVARSLAETGRADDEELEALRPGLVASPAPGGTRTASHSSSSTISSSTFIRPPPPTTT